MARLTNALLSEKTAFHSDASGPMLDLANGGQHGWSPNLTEWVSNQAYVTRPLVCMLLEYPKFFDVMPNPDAWIQSLKSMFELHARTIEGLNATLTVETDEHPVGGAGEVQEEFTDVKRERSVPRFTFIEKYGRPIQTMLEYWIRYGMMDPETKFSLAWTLRNENVNDLLADWYTCTCLFFEPDPLHRHVNKAWISTNMFPKTTGEITAKRDLTTAQEILTLDVEFSALTQYGAGVKLFAQNILDQINTQLADPYMKPAFVKGIDANVVSAANGYKEWTERVGSIATVDAKVASTTGNPNTTSADLNPNPAG